MKSRNKRKTSTERNWLLVIVATILIVIGLALLVLAICNIHTFGWGSLTVGLTGVGTAGAACIAIIENDPTWILLDLILP